MKLSALAVSYSLAAALSGSNVAALEGQENAADDILPQRGQPKERRQLQGFDESDFWDAFYGLSTMSMDIPTIPPIQPPTDIPTAEPTSGPTKAPTTDAPTTNAPTPAPTNSPTENPETPMPSVSPTTAEPTVTLATPAPSVEPDTASPTATETLPPSIAPATFSPSTAPVPAGFDYPEECQSDPATSDGEFPQCLICPEGQFSDSLVNITIAGTTLPCQIWGFLGLCGVIPEDGGVCTFVQQATAECSCIPIPEPTEAPLAPTESPVQATGTPTPGPTNAPTPRPSLEPTAAPTGTPLVSVLDRILPFALQGGEEFNDPQSYQSRALARTEEQLGIETATAGKTVQYYALYCIFEATNGVPNLVTEADPRFDDLPSFPQWSNAQNWDQVDVDPCDGWFGIQCENGLVTVVNLFSNVLTGVWPNEISLLAADGPTASGAGALQTLDLFNNAFLFNDFDLSWISDLGSTMERLYFQGTAFGGSLVPLPVNIFEIDFSFTLIEGGLTNENFAGLNDLNYVILDGLAFNSTVPSVIGQLENLEYLFISDCFLSGDLSYMEGMPRIIEHWVDINPDFGGTIPSFIGDLSTLRSFSVTQSSLIGSIPSELGQISGMIQMWFYANFLTGPIPTELAIPSLNLLQLEGNALTGAMPTEICNLRDTFLTTLGADCSDVQCSFPDCCSCCDLVQCNPFLV